MLVWTRDKHLVYQGQSERRLPSPFSRILGKVMLSCISLAYRYIWVTFPLIHLLQRPCFRSWFLSMEKSAHWGHDSGSSSLQALGGRSLRSSLFPALPNTNISWLCLCNRGACTRDSEMYVSVSAGPCSRVAALSYHMVHNFVVKILQYSFTHVTHNLTGPPDLRKCLIEF
jgi:hypothetical protein